MISISKRVFLLSLLVVLGILTLMVANKRIHVYETIAYAQYLHTTEEKVDYMVDIGQMYLDQKDYVQAHEAAEYVVQYLDSSSDKAREIMDLASDNMRAAKHD